MTAPVGSIFKPGDVVRLKSGGSMMTVFIVQRHEDGTPLVGCIWHNKRDDTVVSHMPEHVLFRPS